MTPGRPVRDPLQPKPPRTMRRGLVLAVLVHVLLVVGLAISVNWKSSEPPAVEAELWSAVPKAAAPRAVEPTPEPTPEPKPAPQPTPTPPPPPPPPVRVTPAPPPQVDPQIAIEQDKRKRDEEKREQLEQQQEQQRIAKAKADKERQAKADAAQRQQDEQDRKDKLAADRKEKELEQQKAEKLAQQKAQQLAQQKAAKDAQLKQEREAQTLAAQREANLKRIMGQAGATGGENATGTELRSSGPSSTYGGRVAARVKPNIVFGGDEIPGNPTAEVEVRIGPDGTIIGRRLTKSSGAKEWDDAVLRAIDRTGTLPRDTDGRVPPSLVIAFRPRDL
ncbi:MAG: protein TolA [Rhizobacter sp.]|nr:protein TolA [Rhizobacter sp.]